MTAHQNLKFLYLMEIFSGLARGSYLVCIGWTTLIVSNDVARVGQVFIVAMLTNMLAGPLVGVIVDRYNRKHVAIVAHLLIALPLAMLALALAQGQDTAPDLPLIWFFVAVIVVSAFRMLYHIAHDGLIHANVDEDDLVQAVARFRGVHLFAVSVGTIAAGMIIERFSPAAGFLFSASMSILLIIPMVFVAGVKTKQNAAGYIGFVADFAAGLDIFRSNRMVRLIAILAAVTLPVGQLSNAILSSFIRDDLGGGSDAFGFVDAAWPIGGMLAAMLLSLGLRVLSAKNMEYVFGLLVGLSTIIFSLTTSIVNLAIVHAMMGFSVWLCRIIIDGRVLQICEAENVGRTKVYVEMMFSLSAMIMAFSPTLVKLPSTSGYFLFWGGFVVIATLLVMVWQRVSGSALSRVSDNAQRW